MYVTFSKNVFIPVTNICRNRCYYCGFRRDIRDEDAFLLNFDEVEEILRSGRKKGCSEALFTFGEYPEAVEGFAGMLEEEGYESFIEYVRDLCKLALDIGMLPHTNPGSISFEELKILKEVNASMGLMLESTAKLKAHEKSPGKDPQIRIETIEDAGRLKIPFTTGILVGIGEGREDRRRSLEVIRDLYEKYGHIQEVIIQNFVPKRETKMENYRALPMDELVETVTVAREILPKEIAIQIPSNLVPLEMILEMIRCGANDLGGISPITPDHINPESKWPSEEDLREILGDSFLLKERLPIYPAFIKKNDGWYSQKSKIFEHSERVSNLIERYADDDGFKREG